MSAAENLPIEQIFCLYIWYHNTKVFETSYDFIYINITCQR